jgi:hypothetical protein
MSVYRIYTEDKNRDKVIEIISNTFEGFNVSTGTGIWKGKIENSLIIEIIDTWDREIIDENVEFVSKKIKELNQQETVLITKTELQDVTFI